MTEYQTHFWYTNTEYYNYNKGIIPNIADIKKVTKYTDNNMFGYEKFVSKFATKLIIGKCKLTKNSKENQTKSAFDIVSVNDKPFALVLCKNNKNKCKNQTRLKMERDTNDKAESLLASSQICNDNTPRY